jgi:hypothetical protein
MRGMIDLADYAQSNTFFVFSSFILGWWVGEPELTKIINITEYNSSMMQ